MDILITIGVGVVAGAVIGLLARLIVPGREALSMGSTLLIGIFAAIAGGFVADGFGLGHEDGFDWVTALIQLGVGVVIVAVFHIPMSRRSTG